MRFIKTGLTLIFCLLMAFCAQAQRSKGSGKTYYSKSANNRPPIRMSRKKAKVVCPVFEDTGYPYHGFGFKVGDPFALTYKYYASKHFAVAVDGGRAASGLYSRYYNDLFYEYYPSDADFIAHKVKADWVGEVKLLYQMNIEQVSPGLQLYAGLGWEIRNLKIQYDYYAEDGVPPIQTNFKSTHDRVTQGAQAVIGIEYSYFKLPISAFMEMEYYYDLLKDPGYRKVQGGVGLRYVF